MNDPTSIHAVNINIGISEGLNRTVMKYESRSKLLVKKDVIAVETGGNSQMKDAAATTIQHETYLNVPMPRSRRGAFKNIPPDVNRSHESIDMLATGCPIHATFKNSHPIDLL